MSVSSAANKVDEGTGGEQVCEEHGRCAGQRAEGAAEERKGRDTG